MKEWRFGASKTYSQPPKFDLALQENLTKKTLDEFFTGEFYTSNRLIKSSGNPYVADFMPTQKTIWPNLNLTAGFMVSNTNSCRAATLKPDQE